MFKVNARCQSFSSIARDTWITRIHGKSHKRDDLEDALTISIPTRGQVSHILYMSKGLTGNLNKENGKGDIRRHILYIDGYSVRGAIIAIAAHDRHQTLRGRKCLLDATRHQRKLQNGDWAICTQNVDGSRQASALFHLLQKLDICITY